MSGPIGNRATRTNRAARWLAGVVVVSLLAGACAADEGATVDAIASTDGAELFEMRAVGGQPGCITCHSTAAGQVLVGPSLSGVAARAANQVSGLDAEGYLTQSIIDPRAHIVDGFDPKKMPTNFNEIFTSEQVQALVDYLIQLK